MNGIETSEKTDIYHTAVSTVSTVQYLYSISTARYHYSIGTVCYLHSISAIPYLYSIGTVRYLYSIGTVRYLYSIILCQHNMKSESAEEAYFHSTPVSSSHPRNELCRETVTSSPQPSLVRDRSSTSSAINSDKESTSADGQSKPTRDQQPAADVCSQSPPNSPLSSTGDIRPSVAQIIHAIQGSSFSTVDGE